MAHDEREALKSVTEDELDQVKDIIYRWSKFENVYSITVNNIKKISKQLEALEQMVAENKIDSEGAEKTKGILRMRMDSLIDMQQKATLVVMEMEQILAQLDDEERMILYMKHIEQYPIMYILTKMNISRATFFRYQNKILRRIALMRRERRAS